jgi:hypothetical protein
VASRHSKENQQHNQGTYRGFAHYRPLFLQATPIGKAYTGCLTIS